MQPACSSVRSVILTALIACGGDKQPPGGSGVAPIPIATPSVIDAGEPATRFPIPKRSGKPPVKTTHPLDRDRLTKLSVTELGGFVTRLEKLDDGFLAVEHTLPPFRIEVAIQPCLRCLPMELDRWRAEADTLRIVIPPDLRDRSDTAFEVGQVSLSGAPVMLTYQLAYAADNDVPAIGSHAVTLYYADGVNQIRVIAAFAGAIESREALLAAATRAELEALALAALDRYVQAW